MVQTPSQHNIAVPDGSLERMSYLAVKLGELIMRRAETALAPLGLKPREYNVMTCIFAGEELSQRDLSRTLGLYASGLVGLLDNLQEEGLIARKRSQMDRRRHVLALTEAGKSLLQKAGLVVTALEDELFGGLSAREQGALRQLVAQVIATQERTAPNSQLPP